MTEQITTEQIAESGAGTPPQGPPQQPAVETPSATGGATDTGDGPGRPEGAGAEGLLGDSGAFIERWNGIQATFVDEPRQAVERADALVAEVIRELARTFADERQRLEVAWSGGKDVSTEDLRQTLQRYREFFQTLLRS
ncbi:MAG TPA: hypothetical protein VH661_00320 [Candidatus Dormibacteraeota bacterium]|jgi:hypothetical protein|nr:hypothetical protein [Candidatus Dormibacteraeota bacterium]